MAHIDKRAIHRPLDYTLSALSVRLCDDHFYTMHKLYGNAESVLFDEPKFSQTTTSGLIDRLTFALCSKYEVDYTNENTRVMHLSHPYLERAQWVLFRINTFRPPPVFVVHEKDIPDDVTSSFQELQDEFIDNIMTNVVRNILESIDPIYFHTNKIYGKVQWRIEP